MRRLRKEQGVSGADPKHELQAGALLVRADAGDLEAVRSMGDVDVDQPFRGSTSSGYNLGGTALMYAARSGHAHVVEYLLSAGAEGTLRDAEDWNALHYACFSGHADIAALLLDAGVPSDLTTQYERATPCGFAEHRRFSSTVEVFSQRGLPTKDCPSFSPAEEEAAREKALGKLSRLCSASSEGEPVCFLFRYLLQPSAVGAIRDFLSEADQCVSFQSYDNVLKSSVHITMDSSHVRHLARACDIRDDPSTHGVLLRASSISGVQHITVVTRAERPAGGILAIGDSLTEGFTDGGARFHPYSRRLETLLCTPVHQHGVSGEVCFEIRLRLRVLLEEAQAEGHRFSYVCLMAGTNDLQRSSAEEIYESVEDMYRMVQKHGAVLVALTIPDACFGRKLTHKAVSVNERIAAFASSAPACILVDVRGAIPYSEAHFDDGLHMSPAGYDRLADIIAEAIRSHRFD